MSAKTKGVQEVIKEETEVSMEHFKAMKEDMERKMNEMRAMLEKELKMGKKYVEDEPLLSAGLAFGVGIALGAAIGMMLSKNKD